MTKRTTRIKGKPEKTRHKAKRTCLIDRPTKEKRKIGIHCGQDLPNWSRYPASCDFLKGHLWPSPSSAPSVTVVIRSCRSSSDNIVYVVYFLSFLHLHFGYCNRSITSPMRTNPTYYRY